MKILVCIKQVPDPETVFRVEPATGRVASERRLKLWMNRADESAVEEALLMKETLPEPWWMPLLLVPIGGAGPGKGDGYGCGCGSSHPRFG